MPSRAHLPDLYLREQNHFFLQSLKNNQTNKKKNSSEKFLWVSAWKVVLLLLGPLVCLSSCLFLSEMRQPSCLEGSKQAIMCRRMNIIRLKLHLMCRKFVLSGILFYKMAIMNYFTTWLCKHRHTHTPHALSLAARIGSVCARRDVINWLGI